MATGVEQQILKLVKSLSSDQQKDVLRYVEGKIAFEQRRQEAYKADPRSIWEIIEEISSQIPMDEWEKLPSDGAVNHDHYLYGAPKRY
jgi:hypothetical protein